MSTMQGDLSSLYVVIRDGLKRKHEEFISKYGPEVSIESATREMTIDRVSAKIKFVAKIFKDAGIISAWREVNASGAFGDFPQSIELSAASSHGRIYLLNDAGCIIVSNCVGVADQLDANVAVVMRDDHDKICLRYHNVLEDDFNWEGFCSDLLDAAHKVLYCKTPAMKRRLESVIRGKTDS